MITRGCSLDSRSIALEVANSTLMGKRKWLFMNGCNGKSPSNMYTLKGILMSCESRKMCQCLWGLCYDTQEEYMN